MSEPEKINLTFLNSDWAAAFDWPMSISGDKFALVLRKGNTFDRWLTDSEEVVIGPSNEVMPRYKADRAKLHRMIDAWLDDADLNQDFGKMQILEGGKDEQ